MAEYEDLRFVGLSLITNIGAHAVEHPEQADTLMLGLLKSAQAWLGEDAPKPVRIMVAEPPPAEPSMSPAADAARARWEEAIVEMLSARWTLYGADPRHAYLMDINLIRLLAGAGEVKA